MIFPRPELLFSARSFCFPAGAFAFRPGLDKEKKLWYNNENSKNPGLLMIPHEMIERPVCRSGRFRIY